MQLDYIIADEKAVVSRVWDDHMVPIGLDHRCVKVCTLLVDMEGAKQVANDPQTLETVPR